MRQIERWAQKTQIEKIFSFFDALPRFIHVPKPLLLGSNNDFEILVTGDATTSLVRRELANLDEPFNPNLGFQRFVGATKRDKPLREFPINRRIRKDFPELCLLKGSGPCGQKIVNAHSIQEALFRKHAKNGHVYHFDAFGNKHDADKRLWPDLVGIHNATTFTGLCDSHDSLTFWPIENALFKNTGEHRFLYHYRAFAQAYYARAHGFKVIESMVNELSKKYPPVQLRTMVEQISLNELSVREHQTHKSDFERRLSNKDWSAIEGYAFEGETMPDILGTDFVAPRKNFDGRIIQDCKSKAPLKWVSLTVAASNDKAIVLFCGEKGCRILRELVQSFRRIPAALQSQAVVNYIFCHFENFIILPKWWESLPKELQLKFVNAVGGRFYRRELPITCDWRLKEVPPQN